jgi:hypothetical protein
MNARRAGLGALFALAAGACNGHFAFDEHTPPEDAATADHAAPTEDETEEQVTCSADSPACLCSGTLCSCARQRWCLFTGSACTAGTQCGFLCHNDSRCDGHCEHDCKLECEHESTCTMTMGEHSFAEGESSVLTVTVGAMSKVHCENNATCHVTCTGSCTLECQSGARCDLRCAGDDSARSADQGGSCSR